MVKVCREIYAKTTTTKNKKIMKTNNVSFGEFVKNLRDNEQGEYNFESLNFADFCGSKRATLLVSADEQGFTVRNVGGMWVFYRPTSFCTYTVREAQWGDLTIRHLFYSDLVGDMAAYVGNDKKAQKEVLSFLAERVEALFD